MVRAAGSYPAGRWFESDRRYQKTTAQVEDINTCFPRFCNGNAGGDKPPYKACTSGPMVKRLRHHPFTVVSWVRIPLGSPNKLKANPFPLGDGFAFVFRLKK